jgi:signal peptidase I
MTAGRLVVLVMIVITWIIGGPVRWGGTLAAVTIRGTSMHPGVTAGDLVLVRHDPPYRVGDVIAHDAGPGRVLHRVVALDGDRLVLRGDANTHDDDIRPHTGDVIGRQVLVVPRGEALARRAGVPALVAIAALHLSTVHRRRRRRRR